MAALSHDISQPSHVSHASRMAPLQFTDEHGTRWWPRCIFQGLAHDPVDQFAFVYLGGQLRELGARKCDVWHEPGSTQHCPCAAPSGLLGGQHTVVEIGANDGLHMSNSYFFERHLGWRSLCIEANPRTFQRLLANRPRCASVNALVGIPGHVQTNSSGQPHLVPFISLYRSHGVDKLISFRDWETGLSGIEGSGHKEISSLEAAQAFATVQNSKAAGGQLIAERAMLPMRPFAQIFQEHSVADVDILFVDVEGAEMAVLSSIDFAAVRIGLIVIECEVATGQRLRLNHSEAQYAARRGKALVAFLEEHGYRRLPFSFPLGDYAFARRADLLTGASAGGALRNSLTPSSSAAAGRAGAMRQTPSIAQRLERWLCAACAPWCCSVHLHI